jgi:hypothetical protein
MTVQGTMDEMQRARLLFVQVMAAVLAALAGWWHASASASTESAARGVSTSLVSSDADPEVAQLAETSSAASGIQIHAYLHQLEGF